MPWAVLVTGDHATIARAELEARLGPASWLGARVALTDASADAIASLGFLRSAGGFVGHGKSLDALAVLCGDGDGSAAVHAERLGGEGLSRSQVERRLGKAIADAGHRIDLKAPERTWLAWIDGDAVTVAEQRLIGATDHDHRGVERRAHFSPVSLRPRLARALVHLTGCRPGDVVYDPFCGTGGIVLEAAMLGMRAMGSDRDPWMVQGTLGTLADVGPEPLDGDVFEADIGDAAALVGTVDGIATDLPYGGASTTNREDLAALYDRALAAFAAMLPAGHRAVIGHADTTLLGDVARHGFAMEQIHDEYVHKSLTRRFAVVKRLP